MTCSEATTQRLRSRLPPTAEQPHGARQWVVVPVPVFTCHHIGHDKAVVQGRGNSSRRWNGTSEQGRSRSPRLAPHVPVSPSEMP